MKQAAWAVAAAGAIVLAAVLLLRESAEAPPVKRWAGESPTAPRVEVPTVRTGSAQLSGRVRAANGEPVAARVEVIFADRPSLPPSCEALAQGCACSDDFDEAIDLLERAFTPLAAADTGPDGRFVFSGLPSARVEVRAHTRAHHGLATVALDGRSAEVDLAADQPLTPPITIRTDRSPPVPAVLLAATGGRIVDFARVKPGQGVQLRAPLASVTAYAPGHAPEALGNPIGRISGEPDAPVLLRLQPGTVLRGTLVGAAGPIAGQVVQAKGQNGRVVTGCATAVTGPDGRWTLGPLERSTYLVEARQDGKVAQVSADTYRASDGGVALTLADAVTVKGRVIDGQKQPLPGAEVEVTWFPLAGGSGIPTKLVADSAGQFEHRAAPGRFSVTARFESRAPATVHGAAETGVWDVTLQVADLARVTGRLVRADGQPLKDARISATTRNSAYFLSSVPRPTIGATGDFVVQTVAGPVDLDASADGTLHQRLTVTAPAEGVTITLERGGTIEGVVVDAKSAPVKSARLSAVCGDTRASDLSGAEGAFTLTALADGACEVTATVDKPRDGPFRPGAFIAPVDRSARAKVDLRDGRAPKLTLRLEPVKAVTGKVVDEGGRPLAGVGVAARPGDPPRVTGTLPYEMRRMFLGNGWFGGGAFAPMVTTASDGTFAIEGLGDTNHVLQGRIEGLREDSEKPVVVRPGATGVVLVLHPVHFLSVPVRSANGAALTKVALGGEELVPQDGVVRAQIFFAYSGTIAVSAPGHVQVHVPVTISPAADTTLPAVVLAQGRVLTLELTDRTTGDALEGWLIYEDHWLPKGAKPDEHTVPIGAFAARVGAQDHVEAAVSVGADQTRLAVALDRGAEIAGRITTAAGKAPPPNEVALVIEIAGRKSYGHADANGAYAVRGVAAGPARVWAYRYSDQKPGPVKDVEVPASGTLNVPLVAP